MTNFQGYARWAVLAAAVLAIPVIYLALDAHSGPAALSLVDAYPTTVKRSVFPDVEAFSVFDATIGSVTRRAVYARPPSRVTWRIVAPPAAALRGWIGLKSDAWVIAGDGVVFRVGISDGRAYTELLVQRVNPYAVPDDRRWIPISLDLSAFAGKTIDVIFNTDIGPPNVMTSTGTGDLALWGEPIVVGGR